MTVKFRKAFKAPFFVGQLRTQHVSWAIRPMKNDVMWARRAADYWQTQGETFGVVFDDLEIVIFDDPPVVEFRARVKAILPGERVADFVAPRVASQRDQVEAG